MIKTNAKEGATDEQCALNDDDSAMMLIGDGGEKSGGEKSGEEKEVGSGKSGNVAEQDSDKKTGGDVEKEKDEGGDGDGDRDGAEGVSKESNGKDEGKDRMSKGERRKLRVLKNRESAMRSLQKKAEMSKELAERDKDAKEKLERLRIEAADELGRLRRMMFPLDDGGLVVNEHRSELKQRADELIIKLENELRDDELVNPVT